MKVLILANNDVGLYRFRKELIERLIEKGCEIFLSLPYGEMVEPLKEMGCHYYQTSVDRRGINPIKDLSLFLTYRKIIRRIKPDLVVTYTIKPNIYGGFAARLSKTKYAANITGLGTAFQKKSALRMLVTWLYKIGVGRAQTVFFENVENLRVFADEGLVRGEQACLLNGAGVNLKDFSYAEYPANGKNLKFLFIGRVMREKGVEELFAAMRKLRKDGINCSLDILGACEEDYMQRLSAYEAEGWLHYHGHRPDVRPYIAAADCFVLPSWHEGMANTNLESAAMGRPVITSDISGCKEAVVPEQSGFLCRAADSESLYGVMKKMFELSAQDREVMGRNGRKHMEAVFDKESVVEKTVQNLLCGGDM